MKKNWSRIFVLTLVFFSSSSCIRNKKNNFSPRPPKRLHWATEKDPLTFDWTACHDVACGNQISLVMEGLTRSEWGESTIKNRPALAENWKWLSPNQIRFRLRENIVWSDGEPLRAAHFVQAWKYVLQNVQKNPNAAHLFSILNAKSFAEGKVPFHQVGISAPDPLTLLVTLQNAAPMFPTVVSHPVSFPLRFDKPRPNQPTLGPFLLTRWTPGVTIEYARNSRYHGGAVSLDGIEVRILPSSAIRINLFRNREIDFADDVQNLHGLTKGLTKVEITPGNRVFALVFNTQRRPFQDPEVRRAFAQSISREEWDSLFNWWHLPATRLLQVGSPARPPGWSITFAPQASRNVLAGLHPELLPPRPSDLAPARPVARPQLTWLKSEVAGTLAENLQAQWAKNLGVTTEVNPTDGGDKGLPDLMGANAGLFLVPLTFEPLRPSALLEMFTSTSLRNLARWKSKEFDDSLDRFQKLPPGQTTSEVIDPLLLGAEEQLLFKETVVVPLVYPASAHLCRESLRGMKRNPFDLWDFSEATKD